MRRYGEPARPPGARGVWTVAVLGLVLAVLGMYFAGTDTRAAGFDLGVLMAIPGWTLLAGAADGARARRRRSRGTP